MTDQQQLALVLGAVGAAVLTVLFVIEWRRMRKDHKRRLEEMNARHDAERNAILASKLEWEKYQNEELYKPTKVSYLRVVR